MWKQPSIKPLLLVVFALVLLPAEGAFAACIKWSNAPAVIAKNKLLKPGDVRRRAIKRGGEVVSINLCKRGRSYVYRLTVIGNKKRVRDIVINARSGSRVSGKSSGRKKSRKSGSKLENRIINRVKRNLRRYGIKYY
ncbi:MAG: hypothetical protein L3J67_08290 [Hyphomicrobiaceae bacterium]|nr:hypothetical protein [Hyphomicrobiaceae bacterium]